jgi:hypothetical protein
MTGETNLIGRDRKKICADKNLKIRYFCLIVIKWLILFSVHKLLNFFSENMFIVPFCRVRKKTYKYNQCPLHMNEKISTLNFFFLFFYKLKL